MSDISGVVRPPLSLRVLIAEDNRTDQLMLTECLQRQGHTVILAENGERAVALFSAETPDVVLLDIEMPIMNGLEAARRIRALPTGETIPLIFLSAVDDEVQKLQGMALADDFIAKPIEPNLLAAKLNALFRQVYLQRQLQGQIQQTRAALATLEEEAELGAFVLNRILQTARSPDDCVRYLIKPARRFSGDLVLYNRLPDGGYVVLLADAIGHGIAAAFNVFPLMSIFTSMTRKGLSLETIIRQMNRALQQLMPVDRFISAAMVSVDPETLLMRVWNGGLPPILVVDQAGHIKHQFESTHLPLRLASDREIDCQLLQYSLTRADEVILFSDGFLECNHQSIADGLANVRVMLTGETEDHRFDKLAAMLSQSEQRIFHDDVSLISMRCSRMTRAEKSAE